MTTQEFLVTKDDGMSLHLLRRKHMEAGFTGRCIVKFAPELFVDTLGMPGFRHIDDYQFTKPLHDDEIGAIEVFHLVPSSPIIYTEFSII